MIAGAVLLVGLVGVLAAFQQAMIEARLGQNRQQKVMLADAVFQRTRFLDKMTFFTGLPARPVTNTMLTAPVGGGLWVPDPTINADPMDLSSGAYFNILPDGTITPIPPATIPTGTSCAVVPPGTVCREVFTHLGAPFGATNLNATLPSTQVATVWVRITRRANANQPAESDVIMNQVVIQ